MAKVLLLGGTGAMGVYLAPELIRLGFDVFVTSRSTRESDHEKLTFICGNAHDNAFIENTLMDRYDAIVDFMYYSTDKFRERHELYLKNTKHYIYTSSCRVFAESAVPVTEKTPRLLDVSTDSTYLTTDEYALAKARQENILRASSYKNWTIVRPTITYSKARFQLGTLEAETIIHRAQCGVPVILPREMLEKQTTMTWGGDVASMIARLVLKPDAFCEDFNVVSHEHRTWAEIAMYYEKLIGLLVVPVDLDTYIKAVGGKYQILYSRMFNRKMDNSKILKIAGMKEESLTLIYDGLAKELGQTENIPIEVNYIKSAKMDRLTHSRISLRNASKIERFQYYSSYAGIDVLLRRSGLLSIIKSILKRQSHAFRHQ